MKRFINSLVLFCLSNSIVLILVILVIVMSIVSEQFFTLANFLNIISNYSITAIVAAGLAVVVFAGGIDLSFGSIISCCAILATKFSFSPVWIPILLTLLLGSLLGAFNGVFVAKVGIDSFITTLATQGLFLAAILIITTGHFVLGSDTSTFHYIAHGFLLGIPNPIVILIAVYLACWFILRKTLFGKYIYAHGSHRIALVSVGVNASNIMLSAYVLMGIIVAIGSILVSSRLIGVFSDEGPRYLMVVLTGVILSGINLSGGSGSLINVLIAVLVLGVIDNGMVLLSVDYKNQQIIRGCIFVLSVIYNNAMTKSRESYFKKLTSARIEG
jgi:ribose transport system permease protein